MKHTPLRLSIIAGMLASSAAWAEEPAHEGGLPQMDVSTYPSQLFWLFVCFVTLYVLMSRKALPQVGHVLETRRLQVEGDLDTAQKTNEEAEKTKAAFEKSLAQAQKSAASTLASTERAISDRISEEQSKFADSSRKRLSAAEANINKAKADALHSLADVAADIAAGMVEKIAGVQVAKADAKKAVQSVMEKG